MGMAAEVSQADDTLPDGAWKDSFDKIIEPRDVLRERNIIKKDIRASFNMDSSIENSPGPLKRVAPTHIFESSPPSPICFAAPGRTGGGRLKKGTDSRVEHIVKPAPNRITSNPFKCSISPVGAWRFYYFKEPKNTAADQYRFQATPINPNLSIVDYQSDVDGTTPVSRRMNSILASPNQSPIGLQINDYLRNRCLRKAIFEKRLSKQRGLTKTRNAELLKQILNTSGEKGVETEQTNAETTPSLLVEIHGTSKGPTGTLNDNDSTGVARGSTKNLQAAPPRNRSKLSKSKRDVTPPSVELEHNSVGSIHAIAGNHKENVLTSKSVFPNVEGERCTRTKKQSTKLPDIIEVPPGGLHDESCERDVSFAAERPDAPVKNNARKKLSQAEKRKRTNNTIADDNVDDDVGNDVSAAKRISLVKQRKTSRSTTKHICFETIGRSTNSRRIRTGTLGQEQKKTAAEQGSVIVLNDTLAATPKKSSMARSTKSHPKKSVVIAVEKARGSAPKKSSVTAGNRKTVQLEVQPTNELEEVLNRLTLQPGKWRKTLNVWRRNNQVPVASRKSSMNRQSVARHDRSVEFVGVTKFVGKRRSMLIKREPLVFVDEISNAANYKRRVLQRCKQRKAVAFSEAYSERRMLNCRKIGEGVYGEVFMNPAATKGSADDTVLKIIPIEGEMEVNGESQKTFEQILPEIIISMELCNLRNAEHAENNTSGFVHVKKVACIKGKYPAHLVKLWEEYDERKGSENDHPCLFNDAQLYIVLELAFSGQDMEAFVFINAEQAYYALQQITLTLAVGEQELEFEHRDLHWGNVLVLPTQATELTYLISGTELRIPTKGVAITIIDYTLSRMTFEDYCLYNDLSSDADLFSATGDYQFDIYRMMRDVLKNNWETFEPRTNVFWISYIIEKMLNGVKYKNVRSKTHAAYMKLLKKLKSVVLDFGSAAECAKHFSHQ